MMTLKFALILVNEKCTVKRKVLLESTGSSFSKNKVQNNWERYCTSFSYIKASVYAIDTGISFQNSLAFKDMVEMINI